MNKEQQTNAAIKRKDQDLQAFYRPADVVTGCFIDTYDVRFDQMKNSTLNGNLFSALWKFYQARKIHPNRGVPQNQQQLQAKLPINKNPDFKCSNNKIRYTWIGHSTAVIGIGGNANLMIDPVFSDRCSPFQFVGPKRFREVPCTINQLPQIDLVMVSHDHYDHLDDNSIDQLYQLFKPKFVAGLQSKDCFPKNSQVYELDWTQTKDLTINGQKYSITFVPVCHWSKRGLFDTGKRLWGGFVVKTPRGKTIFYSGDTGYCGVFKEIGDKFGGFDLSILPIGAYEPRELLRGQHVNPEEAVKIHKELKSKKSIGVHWGTFPLGFQHWCAARQDLQKAAREHGLKEDQFITVAHGDSFQIEY